jgi:predicted nucleic acid-binding protein
MTIFALDTNIISFVLKDSYGVSDRLARAVSAGHKIVIPPICYYEIKRWLIFAGASAKSRIFDELCESLDIGGLEKEIFDIAANEHSTLKSNGINIDDADVLIASYCIYNGYTLVTDNIKHFAYFGSLLTENWADEHSAR